MKRLFKFALFIAIALLGYLLGWSNTFAVREVTIVSEDREITSEISAKLNQAPSAIQIGQPIARVEKGAIAERLRELPWVDRVSVDRKIFSGEVRISVVARDAIARIEASQSQQPGSFIFLSSELKLFALPVESIAKAERAGGVDWKNLPTVALGNDSLGLRSDIANLLNTLDLSGAVVRKVTARDELSIATALSYQGRDLDVSWGNVKDLALKIKVLDRILELNKKREVRRIDLSSPTSPVVS